MPFLLEKARKSVIHGIVKQGLFQKSTRTQFTTKCFSCLVKQAKIKQAKSMKGTVMDAFRDAAFRAFPLKRHEKHEKHTLFSRCEHSHKTAEDPNFQVPPIDPGPWEPSWNSDEVGVRWKDAILFLDPDSVDRKHDLVCHLVNLQRFLEGKDGSGVETIWTCCVTCLPHLAALCHLIGQTELALRSSMDYLCGLTLDKLRNLSYKALFEECSPFDIFTGVRISATLLRVNEVLTESVDQISWKGYPNPPLSTERKRHGLRCGMTPRRAVPARQSWLPWRIRNCNTKRFFAGSPLIRGRTEPMQNAFVFRPTAQCASY